MNKRYILYSYLALGLIENRALFLLMMEFLSIGGMWVSALALLIMLKRKGIRVGLIALSVYMTFMLTLWFANAFYSPYPEKTDYEVHELVNLCETLINKTNALYTDEFNPDEILCASETIMKIGTVKIKYAYNTEMMDFLNLSGVFIPFTGEAFVNRGDPDFLLPFIASHELSHRNGILNEGQANMHAYIRCMESDIPSFQYSASVYALKYAMNELKTKNEAEYCRLEKSIMNCVRHDLNRMSVTKSKYALFDYASFIPCLIFRQSMTSHGVI